MTIEQLENLADHQKHILITKNKYVDELKEIWFRKWKMEYPHWTTCSGEVLRIGD